MEEERRWMEEEDKRKGRRGRDEEENKGRNGKVQEVEEEVEMDMKQ